MWHGQFDNFQLITVPYSRPTATTITSTRDVLCAHMSRPCSGMDQLLSYQPSNTTIMLVCVVTYKHTRDPHLPSLTASNHSPLGGVSCSQVQDLSSSSKGAPVSFHQGDMVSPWWGPANLQARVDQALTWFMPHAGEVIPASGLNPPTRGVIKYHIPYPRDLTTYWNIVPASSRIPCAGRILDLDQVSVPGGLDHLLEHCPSKWSHPPWKDT